MNVGNDIEVIPRNCNAKTGSVYPMLQTPFRKIASDKDQFLQGLMGALTARNKTKISVEKKM